MGKKSRGKKDKAAKRERKTFDKLVRGLDDLASLDLIDVDEHGWPVGDDGHKLAASILTMLDEKAERDGWDQPHRIISVLRPDVSAAMAPDVADAGGEYMEPSTNEDAEPKRLFILGEDTFDGDVTEVLWWFEPIEPTMAIAIQQEVYTAPPDGSGLRPSEHPDREEIRAINLYTRGGQEYSITRWRGGEVRMVGHKEGSSLAVLAFAVLDAPIPESWPRLPLPKFVEYSILKDLIEYHASLIVPAVRDGRVDLEPDVMENLLTARAGATALTWMFAFASEKELPEDDMDALTEFAEQTGHWVGGDKITPLELSKKATKAVPAVRSLITSATWQEALRLPGFQKMPLVEQMAPDMEMAARDWNNEDFYEALIAELYPRAFLARFDVDDTWQNVEKVFSKTISNLPPEVRPAMKDAARLFTR